MSEPRKRIAILSFTAVDREPRVLRQTACIARDHDVCLVGYGELGTAAGPGVSMRPLQLPKPSRARRATALALSVLGRVAPRSSYWAWDEVQSDRRAALRALIEERPDLIIAHDWHALPVAMRAQQLTGAKLIVDLHEYLPLHWQNRRYWMFLTAPMVDFHLRNAVPRLAAAITVNRTIADKYLAEYGLRCEVVRNIPAVTAAAAFRATDPQHVRLVHHGNATRDRQLHLMIEALALCEPRFTLHFMLVPIQPSYLEELRALADELAPGRVFFDATVPVPQIVPTIARHDIGIFILPPVTFNYHAALPNKFFEFLSAGLAVCVGPSPEMASITREHACGIVTQDFDPATVAASLNASSAADIDQMKQHSLAASAIYHADNEMRVLRELVSRVLPS